MTTALIWIAVVAAVTVLVSLTMGRTLAKVSGAASNLRVGPRLPLLDDPLALLHDVRLREIVRWHDDFLVGFDRAHGSWTSPDHVPHAAGTPILHDLTDAEGQLCLAGGAREPRTRRLLREWQASELELVAVLARDGTFALVDTASQEALLCEQSARP
jgi:hypothetical protein